MMNLRDLIVPGLTVRATDDTWAYTVLETCEGQVIKLVQGRDSWHIYDDSPDYVWHDLRRGRTGHLLQIQDGVRCESWTDLEYSIQQPDLSDDQQIRLDEVRAFLQAGHRNWVVKRFLAYVDSIPAEVIDEAEERAIVAVQRRRFRDNMERIRGTD